MRLIVQRTTHARVSVQNENVGEINTGLMVLIGITHTDTTKEADYVAKKLAGLRIFEDADGKMNRSIVDAGGAVLSISQFTLYGDCRKGNRPSFIQAARPEQAKPLYDYFNQVLRSIAVR